ncbi:hypothetical protein MTP99_015864 [Tenebrio molitor]|nr:hypothetical protein MTP99_015864 [Tenebrio molitor]
MRNLEYSKSVPKCGYGKMTMTKSHFNMVNHAKHHRLPLESFRCERNDLEKYYCKGCNFETDLLGAIKKHNTIHLSEDAIQWYNCDKCEFKTKYNENIKRHEKRIHLSADAVQWFSCDKCEFKAKTKEYLKRHKKRLVCLKPKVLPENNVEQRLK